MSAIENKIKVAVKKRSSSVKKKSVELKIEVDRKLFQGTEWLEGLGRIQPFEQFLQTGIKKVVENYIKSAEHQLKGDSQPASSSQNSKSTTEFLSQKSNPTLNSSVQ